MRKKVFGKQLGRNRRSRTALFRALLKSMVVKGSVKTTKAKAQAVKGELDKLIGLVADGSVTAKREALSRLGNDRDAVEMLFKKYQKLASERKSGFTTSSLLAPRKGDAAPMVSVSWIETQSEESKVKKGAVEAKAKTSKHEDVSDKRKTN